LIGRIDAGTPTYIQNAGYIWLVLLVPLAVIGWFGLNNLLTVSPNIGSTLAAFGKILLLYTWRSSRPRSGSTSTCQRPVWDVLNMWVAILLIIVRRCW
jgi:MFS transporter, NNP family, nitrate/nitrite transporter